MNRQIFWTAMTYLVLENWYFGWNFLPKSEVELVVDGIALILFSLAHFKVQS